jgi:hypothetical protein
MSKVAAIGVDYCAPQPTTLKIENISEDSVKVVDETSGEVVFQIHSSPLSSKRQLLDVNGNEIAQLHSKSKTFYVSVASDTEKVMKIKPLKMKADIKNLCDNGQSVTIDIVGEKIVVIGVKGGRKLATITIKKIKKDIFKQLSYSLNIYEGVDMTMIILLALAFDLGNKEDTVCCLCSEIIGEIISLG